jgi:hypothetical protein
LPFEERAFENLILLRLSFGGQGGQMTEGRGQRAEDSKSQKSEVTPVE